MFYPLKKVWKKDKVLINVGLKFPANVSVKRLDLTLTIACYKGGNLCSAGKVQRVSHKLRI